MKKNQHVVPFKVKWFVQGSENQKTIKAKSTQREAIDTAQRITQNQNSRLLLYDRNGRMTERDSYGNGPQPPKG